MYRFNSITIIEISKLAVPNNCFASCCHTVKPVFTHKHTCTFLLSSIVMGSATHAGIDSKEKNNTFILLTVPAPIDR